MAEIDHISNHHLPDLACLAHCPQYSPPPIEDGRSRACLERVAGQESLFPTASHQ